MEDLQGFEVGNKVYVTKYALTKGIKIKTVYHISDDGKYIYTDRNFYTLYKINIDVFLTLDEAYANAEFRRQKELTNLAFRIEKLKNKKIKLST